MWSKTPTCTCAAGFAAIIHAHPLPVAPAVAMLRHPGNTLWGWAPVFCVILLTSGVSEVECWTMTTPWCFLVAQFELSILFADRLFAVKRCAERRQAWWWRWQCEFIPAQSMILNIVEHSTVHLFYSAIDTSARVTVVNISKLSTPHMHYLRAYELNSYASTHLHNTTFLELNEYECRNMRLARIPAQIAL